MKIVHILSIAGLVLCLGAPLDAQRKGGKGGRFDKLDANDDGKISVAEAKDTRLAKAFEKIDANSDGFITKEEMKTARKGRKGKGRRGKGKRGKGQRGKGRRGKGRRGKGKRGEKGGSDK